MSRRVRARSRKPKKFPVQPQSLASCGESVLQAHSIYVIVLKSVARAKICNIAQGAGALQFACHGISTIWALSDQLIPADRKALHVIQTQDLLKGFLSPPLKPLEMSSAPLWRLTPNLCRQGIIGWPSRVYILLLATPERCSRNSNLPPLRSQRTSCPQSCCPQF